MSQRWRRALGLVALAAAAGVWLYALLRELPYAVGGVAGTAKVEAVTHREHHGRDDWVRKLDERRVKATVVHTVDGHPVRAAMTAWFAHLHVGDEVAVVYLPGRPEVVEPASPWRRYLPLAVLGAVLAGGCHQLGVFGLFRRPPDEPPGEAADAEPGAPAAGGG